MRSGADLPRKDHDFRGGPNRIGQGIEFDYCCVHASFALREAGYETIMVNCNPETVSTDYDTSDRLYFEPLTLEDVLEIVHREEPKGVIVQFGGQTPLKLALALEKAGAPIVGTTPDSIDLAEDRERFQQMLNELGLRQPPNAIARNEEEAVEMAQTVGYPLVVRPSYVLGGRAMEIVHNEDDLKAYVKDAVQVSDDSPVLLDRFLDQAVEVDVDAVADGEDVVVGGIMQHIEQAGVHSGDSGCSITAFRIDAGNTSRAAGSGICDGPGIECRGSDEYAVRDPERHCVCVGSQSTGIAHGALRLEGGGRAAGQGSGAGHGGRKTSGLGHHAAADAALLRGEGVCVSLRQIPRSGSDTWAGDEVHR